MDFWPMLYFTIAFGVLILSCLLLILFGFDILKNTAVVVVAALIPLSMSLAIITLYLPQYHYAYLTLALIGLSGIQLTRMFSSGKLPIIWLAITHGIAGLVIFILPLWLSLSGVTAPSFALVGIGGAVVGLAGLLLAVLKAGADFIPEEKVIQLFPLLLLLSTALFVFGLNS
ncbi:hypothetical protein DRQ50_14880 [bacterium]|nr:MAG: hypothetical protein DRQ50_14880 [bacterium]